MVQITCSLCSLIFSNAHSQIVQIVYI
jgi:hypothetical protein